MGNPTETRREPLRSKRSTTLLNVVISNELRIQIGDVPSYALNVHRSQPPTTSSHIPTQPRVGRVVCPGGLTWTCELGKLETTDGRHKGGFTQTTGRSYNSPLSSLSDSEVGSEVR